MLMTKFGVPCGLKGKTNKLLRVIAATLPHLILIMINKAFLKEKRLVQLKVKKE